MSDFIQIGEKMDFLNNTGADIAYYDVVPVGTACIGVAEMEIPQKEMGTVNLEGVWELTADNATVFNVGDMLYWNTAGKKLTKTNTDVPAGICVLKKDASTETARVKLLGNGIPTGE
nr:MAG TPA: protein of unknown function DUF2190 [Caudoviricetes sp.]